MTTEEFINFESIHTENLVKISELTSENQRLRAENEKLKTEECLCPSCGADWTIDQPSRFRMVIIDKNQKLREENATLRHEFEMAQASMPEVKKLRERIEKLRIALYEIGTESGPYANTILAARRALTKDDDMEEKG